MAKTYQDLMSDARAAVPEVSPEEAKARLAAGRPVALLDVREREEYRQGYIPGAVSLPRGFLEMRVEEVVPDKSTPVIAYCQGGTRSLLAGRLAEALKVTGVPGVVQGIGARFGLYLGVTERVSALSGAIMIAGLRFASIAWGLTLPVYQVQDSTHQSPPGGSP